MVRTRLMVVLTSVVGLTLGGAALADEKDHQNKDSSNVAIGGYDPVSYFAGKPAKGDSQYAADHLGATYRFSSAANRDAFKKDPGKYAPKYGGYCAYAMAEGGSKVEPAYTNYKIRNGELLLFYKDFFTNTRDSWNKDEAGLYPKAEANWVDLTR